MSRLSIRKMAPRSALTLCALLGSTLLASPMLAQARQPVVPEGTRATATLTPGIRVGNMIFASGQLGARTDSTIQTQTKSALEATKKVFEAAGTTIANTVKCTVFLIDVKDFAGMNEAYSEFFKGMSPPARSTVVVAALVVPYGKVEIECFASIP